MFAHHPLPSSSRYLTEPITDDNTRMTQHWAVRYASLFSMFVWGEPQLARPQAKKTYWIKTMDDLDSRPRVQDDEASKIIRISRSSASFSDFHQGCRGIMQLASLRGMFRSPLYFSGMNRSWQNRKSSSYTGRRPYVSDLRLVWTLWEFKTAGARPELGTFGHKIPRDGRIGDGSTGLGIAEGGGEALRKGRREPLDSVSPARARGLVCSVSLFLCFAHTRLNILVLQIDTL